MSEELEQNNRDEQKEGQEPAKLFIVSSAPITTEGCYTSLCSSHISSCSAPCAAVLPAVSGSNPASCE